MTKPPVFTHAGRTIPSLDGIRAVAIIMVFFAHSGFEIYIPGGLGRWLEQPCARLRKRLHQQYLAAKPSPEKLSVVRS